MKRVVLCIGPDRQFTEMIKLLLEEADAEVHVAHDLSTGLKLVGEYGEVARIIVIDAFETRHELPARPTSLDFIRKARRATEATFVGMSAIGGDVCEAMVGDELCQAAYDTTEIVAAVESLLIELK